VSPRTARIAIDRAATYDVPPPDDGDLTVGDQSRPDETDTTDSDLRVFGEQADDHR